MGKRRSKVEKSHGIIRQVLSDNVRTLRDRKFSGLHSVTARNRELARQADTTLPQVQRLLNGTLGTSVDFVESLGRVFSVSPADLLTPYVTTSSHAREKPAHHTQPGTATARRLTVRP